MRRQHSAAVIVLALLVTTAGCVGPLAGDDDGPADDLADDATADRAAFDVDDDTDAADSPVQTDADAAGVDRYALRADRQLIRTGAIELRVDDVRDTSSHIREMTIERGGFVSAGSQQVHEKANETWRTERLVIRVPSEEFDRSMADIEAIGEVESMETETEDVTAELVDLDARLDNLAAERDRLRALFEDANETADVLAVQRELSNTQEEIERLRARQQSLEEDVALSTISIHLAEESPEPTRDIEEQAWYDTGAITAFLESIGGVVLTVRAIAVGLAYVLPFAIAFGTPILGSIAVYRLRRS